MLIYQLELHDKYVDRIKILGDSQIFALYIVKFHDSLLKFAKPPEREIYASKPLPASKK